MPAPPATPAPRATPAPLSPSALAAAVAAEADDIAPFIFWRLGGIAHAHPDALRQVIADAFVIALEELGAVLVSRTLAEIRVPGGPLIYEHFHALFSPGTLLVAATAFQAACGGPSLIGRTPFDWEVRGSWTYACA